MIRETVTTTSTCRKCHGEKIVKNGRNRCGSPQYKGRDCGASGVLSPKAGYTEAQKEQILAACEERPSLLGIERIFGVARQTVAAWLKGG